MSNSDEKSENFSINDLIKKNKLLIKPLAICVKYLYTPPLASRMLPTEPIRECCTKIFVF